MKNLDQALKKLSDNNNFFDSNYTLEELLEAQQYRVDQTEEEKIKYNFACRLRALSSPICEELLNFDHYSSLMDADFVDQKFFFERFDLKEKKYSEKEIEEKFDDKEGKKVLKIALSKEFSRLNKSIITNPIALNALKEIQFFLAQEKDVIFDIESLLEEIKNSKVLLMYVGCVVTKNRW